jgi:thymidylate synthase
MTTTAFPTPYEQMVHEVLTHGHIKTDRTGTGTISQFGKQARFDLMHSFPLITSKQVPFKIMLTELLWFLRGDTNATWLQERNCKIWNEWALLEDKEVTVEFSIQQRIALYAVLLKISIPEANWIVSQKGSEGQMAAFLNEKGIPTAHKANTGLKGDLGPIYGKQWRAWKGTNGKVYDQIATAIELLKTTPDSRRILVNAWKVDELDQMALMPCHTMFQFYTRPIPELERKKLLMKKLTSLSKYIHAISNSTAKPAIAALLKSNNIPEYYLSCQLYQR